MLSLAEHRRNTTKKVSFTLQEGFFHPCRVKASFSVPYQRFLCLLLVFVCFLCLLSSWFFNGHKLASFQYLLFVIPKTNYVKQKIQEEIRVFFSKTNKGYHNLSSHMKQSCAFKIFYFNSMHGFPFVSLLFPEEKQSETIKRFAVQIFDLKSMQGKKRSACTLGRDSSLLFFFSSLHKIVSHHLLSLRDKGKP